MATPGWTDYPTADGNVVSMPSDMPPEEAWKIIGSQTTTDYTKNLKPLEPTQQDQTAGKIPPVTPTGQMPPGAIREIGIGTGQFIRGLESPVAIPGDINTAASQISGGLIPVSPHLITSTDLDRINNQLGITPSYLTPQNWWERDLAAGARGAGEGAGFLIPGRVLGTAAYPFTGSNALTRVGSFPMNMATGTTSGVASAETADLQRRLGTTSPDSGGLAPLVAPAAGTVAGFVTGGGIQGAARAVGATPYRGVVNALGGDLSAGTPLRVDAGEALQTAVRAGGYPASGLTRAEYNSIAGRRVSGDTAAGIVLSNPRVAGALRDNYPDEMDTLAGSHLANVNTRADWNGLHPRVKESLIPDAGQRGIVENTFTGGVVPGASFTENLIDAARRAEGRIATGVASEVLMQGAHYASQLAGADPSISSAMSLLGWAMPIVPWAIRSLYSSPITRQGALGGAVGLPQGTSVLSPQGMTYTGP